MSLPYINIFSLLTDRRMRIPCIVTCCMVVSLLKISDRRAHTRTHRRAHTYTCAHENARTHAHAYIKYMNTEKTKMNINRNKWVKHSRNSVSDDSIVEESFLFTLLQHWRWTVGGCGRRVFSNRNQNEKRQPFRLNNKDNNIDDDDDADDINSNNNEKKKTQSFS